MNQVETIAKVDQCVRAVGKIALDDDELLPETQLMDEGFVDSLALINVVISLEKEFNVKFSDADMMREDFSTIQGLAELISQKLV